MKVKPREKENYVSNKEFTAAVVKHVEDTLKASEEGKELPKPSEYIGDCILKISKGIASRPNFSRYSYKDEMVMDGVENCIRALTKYNVKAATRSGTPNAFAYFTQICWYAFLRRIEREKQQEDIKYAIVESGDISLFSDYDGDGAGGDLDSMLEKIKNKKMSGSDRPSIVFKKRKTRTIAPVMTHVPIL